MPTKCPRGMRLTQTAAGLQDGSSGSETHRPRALVLRRGDGFHSFNAFLRLPQRSHFNASRGRLGNIAVLSVQFVTVSTAPVFHARAARVERGE
jgi:hypothetical protein